MALAAGASQANVLDFGNGPNPPSICSTTSDGLGAAIACSNWEYLLQSYGDAPGVDVSCINLSAGNSLRWWASDYNDLYGVLFADFSDSNSKARIELEPTDGGGITLTHFDLGAYPNATLGTTVDVYALSGGPALYSFSGNIGSGSTTHTSFDLNVSSASGLAIEWQNSAYNVGIDNVTFAVSAVPEPASYALMIAGLAACGLIARRRRS